MDRWLTLLEQMFVIRRTGAWHGNNRKRLVKAPKLHFLDSGLLAALRGINLKAAREDRNKFGDMLEGFVFTELAKLIPRTGFGDTIHHYRDKDQTEVDFVIERDGKVLGIEVKAAMTVRPGDLRGLKRLQGLTGADFACGIVLHDGERIQRLGDQFYAMPVHQLWA